MSSLPSSPHPIPAELIRYLQDQVRLSIFEAEGQKALATVVRFAPAAGQVCWAVTDLRRSTPGRTYFREQAHDAAALLVHLLGVARVRAHLARHRHERLFPIGSSLTWQAPPISAWRPSYQAQPQAVQPQDAPARSREIRVKTNP